MLPVFARQYRLQRHNLFHQLNQNKVLNKKYTIFSKTSIIYYWGSFSSCLPDHDFYKSHMYQSFGLSLNILRFSGLASSKNVVLMYWKINENLTVHKRNHIHLFYFIEIPQELNSYKGTFLALIKKKKKKIRAPTKTIFYN